MTDPRCNFYIGQKVVYKPLQPEWHERMRAHYGWLVGFPVIDHPYHVREIFWDAATRRTGIRLSEIVNPLQQFIDGFMEPGFWHCDFKPATDISELEKLLTQTPIPVKQLEPVE